MSPSIYLLIALLKTPGEGGTVQVPFADPAACTAAGAALELQFEALPHKVAPTVLWTCLEVAAPPK